MKQTKRIIRPIAKEFQKNYCCFDNESPDNFVKSQWQNRTKSWIYLIYRTCMALFFIAVVIESMISHVLDGYYFIYLTNWGILLCMLTNLLGAILVAMWHFHPEYAEKITDTESMPNAFKIYWAMHITALISSIIITIIYWTFLYKGAIILSATNILTHAFNSICMLIDLLIVAYPVRLLHIFMPMSFGIFYCIFTVIYYNCGGVDVHGNPYIYEILDWRKPNNTMITVAGTLILCCFIYMLIFIIYKLRVLIYKYYQKESVFIPTTQQHSSRITSSTPPIVQIQSNRISMVFNDYGVENSGFNNSEEKISSNNDFYDVVKKV